MAYVDTGMKIEDLAAGAGCVVEIGEAPVGLFHTEEGLFALDNLCPHRGGPLHEGFVTGGQVTCPWHQWQFDLKDGRCRNIPGPRVAAYPVEVRDGTIWIDLEPQRERTP